MTRAQLEWYSARAAQKMEISSDEVTMTLGASIVHEMAEAALDAGDLEQELDLLNTQLTETQIELSEAEAESDAFARRVAELETEVSEMRHLLGDPNGEVVAIFTEDDLN